MPRIVGARAAALRDVRSVGSAANPVATPPNGSALPCSREVPLGGVDDPAASSSRPRRDVSPHAVMPWPPRMQPIACGLVSLDRGDVEPELEAGPAPRHPDDLVAEDPLGQRLAVRRGGDRDAGVGVQVVDVRGVDEGVHRGVDRRGGTALAVQRVVERGDHLVLALDPGVDVLEGTDAVEAQDREARRGEGAEVAAGALHPEQLDRFARDGVGVGALGGGVPARVVRDPRVRAERVRARDQRPDRGVCVGAVHCGVHPCLHCVRHVRYAPQPAWTPPTRSAAIDCWYPDSR